MFFVIIPMHGQRLIIFWNIPNARKQNIMHYKFWKKRSKHVGRLYQKNNAKVRI
jgi:hypothetical protein